MLVLAQRSDLVGAQGSKLVVCDGQDYSVVAPGLRRLNQAQSILVLGILVADPRVIDVDRNIIVAQLLQDVDDAGVTQVKAVFLEREPHHQDSCAADVNAAAQHGLDQLRDDIGAHAVVEALTGQNDLRMVANRFGLVRQIVRIYADAVTADEARTKQQEIPIGAGGEQDVLGFDAHLVENDREFVDQGDVKIALRILDDLRGFGDLDARRLVSPSGYDVGLERIDEISHFGRRPRGHLLDCRDSMQLGSWIDALRAVARDKVAVELQTRHPFQDRNAIFLGRAGIDHRFVCNDIPYLEYMAYRMGRLDQRRQIRSPMCVNRRRNGHDEQVARCEIGHFGREAQPFGSPDFFAGDLERRVMPCPERLDAGAIDVKADDIAFAGGLDSERQADVTEADDRDSGVF